MSTFRFGTYNIFVRANCNYDGDLWKERTMYSAGEEKDVPITDWIHSEGVTHGVCLQGMCWSLRAMSAALLYPSPMFFNSFTIHAVTPGAKIF